MKIQTTVTQDEVRLSATRPLRFQRVEVAGAVPGHDHDFYELCVVVSGRARHVTAEGAEEVEAGTVIVVPVGAGHGFESPRGLVVINGYYLGEWLAAAFRELWGQPGLVDRFFAAHLFRAPAFRRVQVMRYGKEAFERIRRSVGDLEAELEEENPLPVYLRALVVKLLVELERLSGQGGEAGASVWFREEVRRALAMVEECLRERRPLLIGEVARRAGLSPDRLSRVFAEATGWGLQAYYQRRRVQMACGMLLDAGQTQADIVYALGYADAAHFHRFFKRITGLTPGGYRRRFG